MTAKTYLSGDARKARSKASAAWHLFGALIDTPFDTLIGPLIEVFAQELIRTRSASYELPYTLPTLLLSLTTFTNPSLLRDSDTLPNFLLRNTQLASPSNPNAPILFRSSFRPDSSSTQHFIRNPPCFRLYTTQVWHSQNSPKCEFAPISPTFPHPVDNWLFASFLKSQKSKPVHIAFSFRSQMSDAQPSKSGMQTVPQVSKEAHKVERHYSTEKGDIQHGTN